MNKVVLLSIAAIFMHNVTPADALPADLNNDQLAKMFGAAVECGIDALRDQVSAEIDRKSDAIQNQIIISGTQIQLNIRHAKNREAFCLALTNEFNR